MSFEIAIRAATGECQLDVQFKTDKQLIAVTGPSGVGKTTLLNCIAGTLTPMSGAISIARKTLFDSNQSINLPPEQRRCGYVYQDARLFPHLNVGQNLVFGQKWRSKTGHFTLDGIADLLDIRALLDRRTQSLSGGEVKRIAIGRALLSAPDFLLLDEPLVSLDPARAEHILSMIERLRDTTNLPIILVSHDPLEVQRLTNTVIALD